MAAMARRCSPVSRPWPRLWQWPSSSSLCFPGVHIVRLLHHSHTDNNLYPLTGVSPSPNIVEGRRSLLILDSLMPEKERMGKNCCRFTFQKGEMFDNNNSTMNHVFHGWSGGITAFRRKNEEINGYRESQKTYRHLAISKGSWNPSMAMGGIRMHMGHSHHDHGGGFSELGGRSEGPKSENEKKGGEAGERIMRIGLASDVLLTISKGTAGWLSGSTAILADAAHSVSDIVLSGVSLWSVKAARAPSNKAFPYGHGKIETAGALGVALLLMGTGGGIAWHALEVLQTVLPEFSSMIGQMANTLGLEYGHGGHSESHHGHSHSHSLDMDHVGIALAAACLSIGVKEGLYWATKAVGDKYGSQLLKANAWHHRSDAISSLVALVGIGGAMVGVPLLDPAAAIFVAAMILRAGSSIASQSLKELLDIGVPDKLLDPIRQTVLKIPGVEGCLYLRGRKMGSSVHVDVHIAVDPLLSVSAAHNIGEAVRRELQEAYSLVTETMVHIDPADGRLTHTPQSLVEEETHSHEETDSHKEILKNYVSSSSHHHRYSEALPEHSHTSWQDGIQNVDEGRTETQEGEVCGGDAGILQQSDVEGEVREAVKGQFGEVVEVVAVTCHFLQQGAVVEVKVTMSPELTIRQGMDLAGEVRTSLKNTLHSIVEVDVQLELMTSNTTKAHHLT